jgi:urea transport system permease protein
MLLLAGLLLLGAAQALTPERARAIASGDTDARIAALSEAAAQGEAGLAAFVQALLEDAVKLTPTQVLVFDGEKTVHAATGQVTTLPEGAEDVVNNNRMRGALQAALAALKLASPELEQRREAVAELAKQSLDEAQLPVLDQALAAERDAGLKARLELMRAALVIASPDAAKRLAAARQLAASGEPAVKSLLLERLAAEGDPEVKSALAQALTAVERRLAWGERLGLVFTGLSLGSILLLVALGLAISYGLMGVINMAHGELMMVGAYATYVVQNLFRAHLPAAWFDAYVLAAVPVSFLVAAAVGAVLERSVIRWLYGRPLETLLATWGISLVLMQAVRSLFGAQNVPVENPGFMSGGAEVLAGVVLPYSRIAIVAFAAIVLVGMWMLLTRTRLGLFVRGVTQNRAMASCVGVPTPRVDTWAFGLGSGIAGLAGCALSQIGNVGPDLGQAYIVDSFMVVVLGGVGQLAGTVYAALGLGFANKLLESWSGAVIAKILVLVFIIVFIQKRPQGMFAVRGRAVEA